MEETGLYKNIRLLTDERISKYDQNYDLCVLATFLSITVNFSVSFMALLEACYASSYIALHFKCLQPCKW